MGDSPAMHCSAPSLILLSCATGFLPRNTLGDAAMAGAACSSSACQPSEAGTHTGIPSGSPRGAGILAMPLASKGIRLFAQRLQPRRSRELTKGRGIKGRSKNYKLHGHSHFNTFSGLKLEANEEFHLQHKLARLIPPWKPSPSAFHTNL